MEIKEFKLKHWPISTIFASRFPLSKGRFIGLFCEKLFAARTILFLFSLLLRYFFVKDSKLNVVRIACCSLIIFFSFSRFVDTMENKPALTEAMIAVTKSAIIKAAPLNFLSNNVISAYE